MTSQVNPLELCDVSLRDGGNCLLVLSGDMTKGQQVDKILENGEHVSESSSLSEYSDVELPADVPDGPQFRDLATYIDGVTEQIKAEQTSHVAVDVLDTSPRALENHLDSGDLSTKESKSLILKEEPALPSPPHNSEPLIDDGTKPFDLSVSPYPDLCNTSEFASQNSSVFPLKCSSSDAQSENVEEFASFPNFDDGVVESEAAWAGTSEQKLPVFESNHSEWPSESSVPVPEFNEGDDGDDFGDFESSAPQPKPSNCDTDVQPGNHSIGILERLLAHLEPALGRAFPPATGFDWSTDEKGIDNVTDLEDETSLTVINPPCDSTRTSLWQKLLPLHRTHDHRFHWSKSPIYDAYLQSVHVDPRSAMPAFASQLRLLEPVRLGAGTRFAASSTAPSTKSSTLSSPVRTSGSPVTTNGNQPPKGSSSTETPEFDWTSSGLTNPLREVTLDAVQLDLDYFELRQQHANPNATGCSSVSDLEKELFSQLSEPPACSGNPSTQLPMAIQQPTAQTISERSKNVRAALMKLPKLTYMRAKYLIFPVAEEKPT